MQYVTFVMVVSLCNIRDEDKRICRRAGATFGRWSRKYLCLGIGSGSHVFAVALAARDLLRPRRHRRACDQHARMAKA
jgi:hypothetical protein